jgi:Domain of unknown function (DUF4279)
VSEPNEFTAYFTINGDFDPADVTAAIGVQPSKQWRKGDIFGRIKKLERKFSRWSLESRLPSSSPLEEHVKDVLVQLGSVKQQVVALRPKWEPSIETVAYFNDYPTGFSFDFETITELQ